MLGQHIVLRPRGSGVLATTTEHRRLIARTVLRHGRLAGLFVFGLVDEHLHMATTSARSIALEFARRVALSLGRALRLPDGFETAYTKAITNGPHAYRAFRYVLLQEEHHGLTPDPRREASSLPDLLGLRTLGGYVADNVRRFLPRIRRTDLLQLFGLQRLEPADGPLDQVVPAGLAAAALPALEGLSRPVNALRATLLPLLQGVALSRQAKMLGVHRTSIFRWRKQPPDPRLLHACKLQLGLHGELLRRIGMGSEGTSDVSQG